MYHSKVVLLCWAAVFAAAILAAFFKKSRAGLGEVLVGALVVACGVAASSLLNNIAGAFILSLALLISAYWTLTGIIKIFTHAKPQPGSQSRP